MEEKINSTFRVVTFTAINYLTKVTFILEDILLRFVRLTDILNYYYPCYNLCEGYLQLYTWKKPCL